LSDGHALGLTVRASCIRLSLDTEYARGVASGPLGSNAMSALCSTTKFVLFSHLSQVSAHQQITPDLAM
jgi:hypothetical protein